MGLDARAALFWLKAISTQHFAINHRGDGSCITHDEFAEMMTGLQRRGCRDINFVTPTHVVPHLFRSLRIAIRMGFQLPLVYKNGGYDSLDVIRILNGIVDICLHDFKFQDGTLAASANCGARPRLWAYGYPLRSIRARTNAVRDSRTCSTDAAVRESPEEGSSSQSYRAPGPAALFSRELAEPVDLRSPIPQSLRCR